MANKKGFDRMKWTRRTHPSSVSSSSQSSMELCGSLLLFLALPPEAGPEGGADRDEGDPVAAEAVMFF